MTIGTRFRARAWVIRRCGCISKRPEPGLWKGSDHDGRNELNPYLSLSVSVKDGTHYRPTVQESRFSEVLAALEIGDRNHVYVAFDSVAAIDRMIEELRDLGAKPASSWMPTKISRR